ncbi:low affinity iron permease family protein [Streptomyces sp. NPDC058864]
MTFRHPAERTEDEAGRGRFERLAETASNFTASPLFYAVCLLLVAGFLLVHALGLPLNWQLFAADLMTAVTLLLLALLKNAERRAEHAVQRKLDAIAAALLEQGGGSHEARDALREVIGLHKDA